MITNDQMGIKITQKERIVKLYLNQSRYCLVHFDDADKSTWNKWEDKSTEDIVFLSK